MRRRAILAVGVLACLVLGVVAATATALYAAGTVARTPFHVGDAATYAMYGDGGDVLGTRTFRVDRVGPVVDGAGAARWAVDVTSAFRSEGLAVTESVDVASGVVFRTAQQVANGGFKEIVSGFGDREPVLGAGLVAAPVPIEGATAIRWHAEDGARGALADVDGCRFSEAGTRRGAVDGSRATGSIVQLECPDAHLTRTLWHRGGTPWPVLAIQRDEASGKSIRWGLASWTHGTGDVVASGDPASPAGPAPQFVVPLSEALTTLDASPPPQFAAWRLTHAGAQLAAATLLRAEHSTDDRPSGQWRLGWAAPDGTGHMVSVEQDATGARTVSDRGDLPSLRFPSRAPPLSALDAALVRWSLVAGEPYTPKTPNLAHWGVALAPTWASDCAVIPSNVGRVPLPSADDVVVAGYTTYGTCMVAKVARDESYVTATVPDGVMTEFTEHRIVLAAFPTGDVARPKLPAVSATSLAFHAPDLVVGVLVTFALLGGFLVAYFLPTLQFLAGRVAAMAGFTRIEKERTLDHPSREALLDLVRAEPGVSATELQRRIGLGWGATAYHLRVLERENLLSSVQYGRNRCFFPGDAPRQPQRALVAVQNPNTQRALDLIRTTPGIGQGELARALGVTPAGALWHVRRLADVGLVTTQREGRHARYYPSAQR